MPIIRSRNLFFTTSPRSPHRMIPEIQLLADEFSDRVWNNATQVEYMQLLIEQDYYQGSKQPKDPALSARDRITRSPKALGLVDLSPTIKLTHAGRALIQARHKEEPLLRQLLKFQLPSPYHTLPRDGSLDFWVKPYLEILRLIRHFGSLSFDELKLFGLQLTNYHKFNEVIRKIDDFRTGRISYAGSYKKYLETCSEAEIRSIYAIEIADGNLKTRESREATTKHFIQTKLNNMRDYTDACFRYLRATALVNISQSGHSLSIAPEKIDEVGFLLATIDRDPVHFDDINGYKTYLFDPELPHLYSDHAANVQRSIRSLDPNCNCDGLSLVDLKDLQHELIARKKDQIIAQQTEQIKAYAQFDDILDVFERIGDRNSYYDRPLMFEWNTWRAMTMIDGGSIRANLKFDDEGLPLSTAAGNLPDIICDYNDFILNVEITLQAGQKQYDDEGEPVARHVGKVKETTGQPVFCFFIAPTISDATKAHFFMLQRTPIRHYGGTTNILPLELETFKRMILDSKKADYTPNPSHIKRLIERNRELALTSSDEIDWYQKAQTAALGWLSIE